MTEQPEVTRRYLGAIQVCVPEEWTPEQIVEFAKEKVGQGTHWKIVEDSTEIGGDPPRRACERESRRGFIHCVLKQLFDNALAGNWSMLFPERVE